jgi:cytochrome c553
MKHILLPAFIFIFSCSPPCQDADRNTGKGLYEQMKCGSCHESGKTAAGAPSRNELFQLPYEELNKQLGNLPAPTHKERLTDCEAQAISLYLTTLDSITFQF